MTCPVPPDYVHRANFELQAYHEEFGVLQELRGSRGLLDPVLQVWRGPLSNVLGRSDASPGSKIFL